ncbi:hypothetical protein J6590_105900, partial [Homalodisca vitripennis]
KRRVLDLIFLQKPVNGVCDSPDLLCCVSCPWGLDREICSLPVTVQITTATMVPSLDFTGMATASHLTSISSQVGTPAKKEVVVIFQVI